MKKIGGLLLALLLMLGCAAAFAAEDADYLTIEIAGHAYVLGESTLADFVGNGWTHYTVETDGMYSMLDEENGSYMYLLPEEGGEGLARAVNAIDLTAADGVPYSYCGIHTDDTGEALSRLFEMEVDEEGGAQGYADLSDGRMVWVYTQGYRLMLGCVGEKKSAGSAEQSQPTAAQDISYETYTEPNGYFTMTLPKGWRVQTGGDYISYMIQAYDPEHNERQIFLMLSAAGFQSKEVIELMERSYPYAGRQSFYPTATTLGFFEAMYDENDASFELIENLGKAGDSDVLHATVRFADGLTLEGVFTASVYSLEDKMGMDLSMTIAESVQALTAESGNLDAWLPVLNQCAGTIQFSDAFMQARDAQWRQVMQTSSEISAQGNRIADGIMQRWNERNWK